MFVSTYFKKYNLAVHVKATTCYMYKYMDAVRLEDLSTLWRAGGVLSLWYDVSTGIQRLFANMVTFKQVST